MSPYGQTHSQLFKEDFYYDLGELEKIFQRLYLTASDGLNGFERISNLMALTAAFHYTVKLRVISQLRLISQT